jgi:hypothetical protein
MAVLYTVQDHLLRMNETRRPGDSICSPQARDSKLAGFEQIDRSLTIFAFSFIDRSASCLSVRTTSALQIPTVLLPCTAISPCRFQALS